MQHLLLKALWIGHDPPGAEYLVLRRWGGGYRVRSVWAGSDAGAPVHAVYRMVFTAGWRPAALTVRWDGGSGPRHLRLHSPEPGVWADASGVRRDLLGCTDVDIAWTPFTNTAAVRRLALSPGAGAEIDAVHIGPDLTVARTRQRYTCLAPDRWRYESLASGYTADLTVDPDGLVREYPGAFTAAVVWRRPG